MVELYTKCFFESTFNNDGAKTQQLGETKIESDQDFISLFLKRKNNIFYHEPEVFSITKHEVNNFYL